MVFNCFIKKSVSEIHQRLGYTERCTIADTKGTCSAFHREVHLQTDLRTNLINMCTASDGNECWRTHVMASFHPFPEQAHVEFSRAWSRGHIKKFFICPLPRDEQHLAFKCHAFQPIHETSILRCLEHMHVL
jgi:hypothetical protein